MHFFFERHHFLYSTESQVSGIFNIHVAEEVFVPSFLRADVLSQGPKMNMNPFHQVQYALREVARCTIVRTHAVLWA